MPLIPSSAESTPPPPADIVKTIAEEAAADGMAIQKRKGRKPNALKAAEEQEAIAKNLQAADNERLGEIFNRALGKVAAKPAAMLAEAMNKPGLVDPQAVDDLGEAVAILVRRKMNVDGNSDTMLYITVGMLAFTVYAPVVQEYFKHKALEKKIKTAMGIVSQKIANETGKPVSVISSDGDNIHANPILGNEGSGENVQSAGTPVSETKTDNS
jgi:hypothetical protein